MICWRRFSRVVEPVQDAEQLRGGRRELARRRGEPQRVAAARCRPPAGSTAFASVPAAAAACAAASPNTRDASTSPSSGSPPSRKRRERPRARDVELAQLGDVGRRERQARRAPDGLERLEVDAGLRGDVRAA